ncbi:clathrin heavy chain 2-like isoform X4 [Stegodyphus dumicola]|uniref:clathrin heavy chain 2-like isoform X4 n=1 Tax=Stegodyphus dumicola TaxID=202533 RepID=UPI0015B25B98|nr:clathrin heavy chain 2-like isoform X4 [Stegodyphus dumicola]
MNLNETYNAYICGCFMSCNDAKDKRPCPKAPTSHYRITSEHITWPRVTMTSDQWICIRHSIMRSNYRNGTAITVLNPHNSLPQTWQAVADCAQMNPIKPVIAVKENQLPVKIFCRDLRMKNAQLVHYATDSNMKWFALSGLVAEDSHVVGITQIFSVDHNLCQNIEAHCVCFTSYQFKGNMQPSCVLVAASRGTEIHGKLHAVELGPHLTGNLAYTSHTGAIEFSDQWFRYDFPSSIQVSSKLGLVYIVTKYGTLHLCDLETCATLCCINVCTDIIFSTAFNKETEGIIAISRNGQVLSIDLKREQLVKYVWEVAKRFHIAERLSQVLKES